MLYLIRSSPERSPGLECKAVTIGINQLNNRSQNMSNNNADTTNANATVTPCQPECKPEEAKQPEAVKTPTMEEFFKNLNNVASSNEEVQKQMRGINSRLDNLAKDIEKTTKEIEESLKKEEEDEPIYKNRIVIGSACFIGGGALGYAAGRMVGV